MKKLLNAIGALGLIGTPAFAADMAVKAPPPAPAPVYSWTGWYIGGNVGGTWSNDPISVNTTNQQFCTTAQECNGGLDIALAFCSSHKRRILGQHQWLHRRWSIWI